MAVLVSSHNKEQPGSVIHGNHCQVFLLFLGMITVLSEGVKLNPSQSVTKYIVMQRLIHFH